MDTENDRSGPIEPRIVRHASNEHRWEMAFLPPPPALRGYVHRICGYDERSVVSLRRRELPSATVALLLELGPPVWIEDRSTAKARSTAIAAASSPGSTTARS